MNGYRSNWRSGWVHCGGWFLGAAAPVWLLAVLACRRLSRQNTAMNTNVLHAGEGRSYWVVGDLYTFLATGEDTRAEPMP